MANAQVNYTDLSPDSVMNVLIGNFTFMELDIDGDNVNDMEIGSTNYPSFGIWNIGVNQLDTNNPKVEILVNTTIPQSQIGDYYAKILSAGDPVDASGTYSTDYPQIADIYNPNFHNQGMKYIGFRMPSGNDYKYGWMAAEVSGSGDLALTISELAFNNTPGQAINAAAGSLSIGQALSLKPLFDVYPNPSTEGFEISCEEDCIIQELKVYSIDGKLMFESGSPSLPLEISASGWESGSYIIQIRDADGVQVSRWQKL